jgi:aspartyl-tRNA synthetase
MKAEGAQLDGMGTLRRSHPCGAIRAAQVGSEVVVAGWVHKRRDHGGVIFVDLRDRDGIVQVVFRPETSLEAHERAGALRSEWVIMVRGIVEARSDDTINPKMVTGEVEVNVHELRILNRATPPPFAIEEEAGADEAVRLRHRIHDLRRRMPGGTRGQFIALEQHDVGPAFAS